MRVDIFSDTICPWCFIGKRRLEKAVLLQDRPLEIHWRAFQLNPDMPAAGMERRAYLEQKFGGAAAASNLYERIRQVGSEEDISFAFDRIVTTPNTVNSHRLVRLAEEKGLQDNVVERLFKAYFLEGKDIGATDVLVELADDAGLSAPDVRAFLEGEDLREEVLAEDLFARQQGIQGVPCFIFEGRYAVSGAQEAGVLAKVMESLAAANDT